MNSLQAVTQDARTEPRNNLFERRLTRFDNGSRELVGVDVDGAVLGEATSDCGLA